MPPKSIDSRLDAMERDLDEMKLELQLLPGLERAMENMAQNLKKVLQLVEKTQKIVVALAGIQQRIRLVGPRRWVELPRGQQIPVKKCPSKRRRLRQGKVDEQKTLV